MSDDGHKWKEPYKTKVRPEVGGTEDARRWLAEGGHIEAPEELLYRHMTESRRRLMVLLPVTMYLAIEAIASKGRAMSPDVHESLFRGTKIAIRYLNPITLQKTLDQIVSDGQQVLREIGADSVEQALLGVSYLIVCLADRDLMPDPTSQSVLVSLAICEEAKMDFEEGRRGTWGYDLKKCERMTNEGMRRLRFSGYL